MVRTLLFSTLYPSAGNPLRGVFVETRLRELLRTGQVQTKVVAPVPWVPRALAGHGRARALAAQAARREQFNGIDVLHPRYLVLPKVGMNIAPLLLAAGARPAVAQLLDEGFDFDVIDAHYYYPDGVAAALLAAHFGKPLAVTARGTDVNLIADHPLPRRWLRWAATRAAASIGVSAALVERMRALSFDPARLHVLRNGVDLVRFRPQPAAAAREALDIRGAPVLLTVGNLHEHKGQHLAIAALALLRAQFPGACLLVVGTGPDDKPLRAQAARAGLGEDAVRFVGVVPNAQLARWYSAADVLLLCSSREGWPNVLLEAMACGTPVVASAVGGVGEIVSSPAAGLMVGARSAEAFAQAAASLLVNSIDRSAVRAHAERFGWEGTSLGQVALFEAIRSHAPA